MDEPADQESSDDQSGGSLSRCHDRSVSHDSYFRLLVAPTAAATRVEPVDEEGETSKADVAIYAEISKKSKTARPAAGSEFGKHLTNLTAVEDPHSTGSCSKMSLNDLSHLDDSELNFMSSREMLCVALWATTTSDSSASGGGPVARAASVDDSVIDDSLRVR